MWVTRCINIDYVYDMVIMLELDVDPSTFNRIRLYVISELVWNSMIPIMVNICFNKWCINGWIDYDDLHLFMPLPLEWNNPLAGEA